MYLLTGFGVTVGFHRMLTHRAFQTSAGRVPFADRSARWPSRARSSTGSPTTASTTPTPTRRATRTSPHAPRRRGRRRAARPLPRAHRLALRPTHGRAAASAVRAATSSRTPACGCINRNVPRVARRWPLRASRALLGFAAHRHARAARSPALLWGGLVRIFLLHHVTWSINSVCHFFGTRRFDDRGRVDATSSGWRCRRSARPGTTTTTPSRARPPRAAPVGARPVGLGHRRDGAARARLERRADRPRAPGAAPRRAEAGLGSGDGRRVRGASRAAAGRGSSRSEPWRGAAVKTAIIVVVIIVLVVLIVLALLRPRMRAKAEERRLEGRRREVAERHRAEAEERELQPATPSPRPRRPGRPGAPGPGRAARVAGRAARARPGRRPARRERRALGASATGRATERSPRPATSARHRSAGRRADPRAPAGRRRLPARAGRVS